MEKELEEKKGVVVRRETAVKNVSQELLKANEIIRKLQEQNRKENNKIKMGCQIVEEQEKVLQEKDRELESTRKELKEKSERLEARLQEGKMLERQLDEVRETADDLAKKVKTNEAVIQWLNKQLTTAQARDPGLRLGPPPDGLNFTPSAMASTSTPLVNNTNPRTAAAKENKDPSGLDPKYLQPTSGNSSRTSTASSRHPGGGGLLRQNNLPSATGSKKNSSPRVPPPQSVYFTKT